MERGYAFNTLKGTFVTFDFYDKVGQGLLKGKGSTKFREAL